MSNMQNSSFWSRARYDEDEARTAAEVLESMYSGTFTVEMAEYEEFINPTYVKSEDSDDEESQIAVVRVSHGVSRRRGLDFSKIAEPLDVDNEHLKDIFGGKIPAFLAKQLAANTREEDQPTKLRATRRKKLPSLEKLEKITRPPNSFMIFAQEYRPKLSQEHPGCKNKDISVMLGNLWRTLPGSARAFYEERSRELAAEHKKKNPWYVYNPQEARVRKAQRDQNKLALRAARQRKNSGHVDQDTSPPPHMMRHPCLPRNGPGMMPSFGAHPHKVFHGSAAAAVSANEMRGLGGPAAVQHAYGASPPPQRFYPAPYLDHNGYSMQYSNHHQLPPWFGQQPHPQYHPQHHQMQPNGGYGNRSLGRELPYMTSHYMPPHPPPHTPQQHQLLGPNNEPEETLAPMPLRIMASQYEVEGTVPPPPVAPVTPATQQSKEVDEKKPSPVDTENPDSQPLPPFQHAFGSTEIGRFAHEGFSAQEGEEIELEVVEMDGEYLVPFEGQKFVIQCTIPEDERENPAESTSLLSL